MFVFRPLHYMMVLGMKPRLNEGADELRVEIHTASALALAQGMRVWGLGFWGTLNPKP